MEKCAKCWVLIFTCIFAEVYAGETLTPSTFDDELVWGSFINSRDGDDFLIIGVTKANVGKEELGAKNQASIPIKVNFPFLTEQGLADTYRQSAQHERWFPAGRRGGMDIAVKSVKYPQNTEEARGELNKTFFPMLHMAYRLASGMHPTSDADLPDSYWWNGTRLFALDGGDMMLISNDAQAYWITRKTDKVQINPAYKDYALPMRIGGNPFMNTPGELPMPLVSSCRIRDTIYLVTQDGSFSSVEVTPGQKPKWSPIMKKPFGDHGVYLFRAGDELTGVHRTKEGRWDLFTRKNGAWNRQENIPLPATEEPLFIKDTFLLTTTLNDGGPMVMAYTIDETKIERDKRFPPITLQPDTTIIDAVITKKMICLLLSRTKNKNTELSICSVRRIVDPALSEAVEP